MRRVIVSKRAEERPLIRLRHLLPSAEGRRLVRTDFGDFPDFPRAAPAAQVPRLTLGMTSEGGAIRRVVSLRCTTNQEPGTRNTSLRTDDQEQHYRDQVEVRDHEEAARAAGSAVEEKADRG